MLIISLGLLTTRAKWLSIAGGVAILTVVGWAINRALGVPVKLWPEPEPQQRRPALTPAPA